MRVAVVGSYGVGMTMRVPRIPVEGETLLGGEFASGHGGKGSNQAVAAARLGAAVTLLTAVGDDPMGRDAHALWRAEGVDASAVLTADGAATMVGVILVEPTGENRIVVAPGALEQLRPEHVRAVEPRLAAADVAVVSLEIPLDTALEALRVAHEAGTRTLLNPAPACPVPDEAWGWVDVLTPNRSEAAILLGLPPGGQEDAAELAGLLHERTGADVVLTCGAEGALVQQRTGRTPVPAVRAQQVVDTTGAGDSFTAALAVELAAGRSLVEAARFAARAGAFTVARPEVVAALPRRHDLEPR